MLKASGLATGLAEVYGMIPSDPTISRLFKVLATAQPSKVLVAINKARTAAGAHAWERVGEDSPLHCASRKNLLAIDLDFHPPCSYLDHGIFGTGKPLATLWRSGQKIMIRTDSAGGTHGFLDWLTEKRRNFSYSVRFTISEAVA